MLPAAVLGVRSMSAALDDRTNVPVPAGSAPKPATVLSTTPAWNGTSTEPEALNATSSMLKPAAEAATPLSERMNGAVDVTAVLVTSGRPNVLISVFAAVGIVPAAPNVC